MQRNNLSHLTLAQLGRQLFADETNWENTETVARSTYTIEEMSKEIERLAKEVSEEVGIEDWRIWLHDLNQTY